MCGAAAGGVAARRTAVAPRRAAAGRGAGGGRGGGALVRGHGDVGDARPRRGWVGGGEGDFNAGTRMTRIDPADERGSIQEICLIRLFIRVFSASSAFRIFPVTPGSASRPCRARRSTDNPAPGT